MRAAIIHGPGDVRIETVPDPQLHDDGDVIVDVTAGCVCGSDLWAYRGIRPTPHPHRIGHELVGVVTAVGAGVRTLGIGDFVIAPFDLGCGHCQSCRHGFYSACETVCLVGATDSHGRPIDGGQGERARIPYADASLVKVPGPIDPLVIPSLLTLSDVLPTGHHAAISAGVDSSTTVVVVGDGAVGLCAVLAAARLGAPRIIAMSRHAERAQLARDFGATDVIAERGDAGIAAVREALDGDLADCALECVGTDIAMDQALGSVRGGGSVGFVGVPAGGSQIPIGTLFARNIRVGGGMAPARRYIPELLADVLAGRIDPGLVFTQAFALRDIAAAYRAMDERTVIKSLVMS
ncbi:zinc-binding dehydrogenase [Rarobacter incanus]|uniref:Threonine dehydrogenase-like Zn-dependent dehydrogenase n=1 Tax=Rarobacter incanus TaxID=153494 RepID=A0A542SPM4_9MICO|nr:alcohol dehydrogenase catalytic domain-containing protein [Rarobacter incanus]TQK76573.1 hypothetical protein FB389_1256 [Rarobacter incanus]